MPLASLPLSLLGFLNTCLLSPSLSLPRPPWFGEGKRVCERVREGERWRRQSIRKRTPSSFSYVFFFSASRLDIYKARELKIPLTRNIYVILDFFIYMFLIFYFRSNVLSDFFFFSSRLLCLAFIFFLLFFVKNIKRLGAQNVN